MSSIHEHDEVFETSFRDDDDIDDDEVDSSSDKSNDEMHSSTKQQDQGNDVTSKVSSSHNGRQKSKGQQSKNKNSRKKSKQQHQQHSLDHLQQRVSALMSIFQQHEWFVPLPNCTSTMSKVKSNRNYGADKKRQRKHAQRQLLEMRIQQLETCLKQEHGFSVPV